MKRIVFLCTVLWTEPTPLEADLPPMTQDDGARVSPDGRFLFFSATHYATAGGVWGKPRALDLVEELSLSSLRAFDAGPQNGRRDIYWIRSTIIEERRRSGGETTRAEPDRLTPRWPLGRDARASGSGLSS